MSNEGLEGQLVGTGVSPLADLTMSRTMMSMLTNRVGKGVLGYSQQRMKDFMYRLAERPVLLCYSFVLGFVGYVLATDIA